MEKMRSLADEEASKSDAKRRLSRAQETEPRRRSGLRLPYSSEPDEIEDRWIEMDIRA
jgi:hypothetical protein